MKKLLLISGAIIFLFVAGLLLPDTDLIFGILLLPTIWMIHYRNIRKGWFWIIFLITGSLYSLKIEYSFLQLLITSFNVPALIFAIRRTFFARGENVKTTKQEPKYESGTFANNLATIKNKQLFKGLINRIVRRSILISIIVTFLLLTLGGGMFYWYEWRPTQIKHDCSWVAVHENAIPASPGVTIEEVEASKKEHPECKGLTLLVPRSGYQSIFQNNGANLPCSTLIKQYKPPQPAQPAKDWWRKASSQEYQFCLHDKGL